MSMYGAASVTPRSVGVGALLEEHHPFWVPRYQRAYAWDTQTDAFIDDVKDLMEEGDKQKSHFFGGFVCIEHINHMESRPHAYEIVDGQQRLATFVLTLSEIAHAADRIAAEAEAQNDDHAERSARTLAQDTRNRFVYWNYANVALGENETRARVTLSKADNEVFQELLTGNDPTPKRESHELLVAARETLRSKLLRPVLESCDTRQDKIAGMARLRMALTGQSHVIQIVCSDHDRAYQLFSVLNDRGRSLADADLLRSYTLEILEGNPSVQEKAALVWDDILSADSNKVSAFFEAYYPSTKGVRANTPLFNKLREAYFPDLSSAPSSIAVLGRIEDFQREKEVYLQLVAGVWPYAKTNTPGFQPAANDWQKDRLRRLVVTLKHQLCIPLLLAAANCVSESRFAELVYLLEIFAFRYKNVCGGHATPPSKVYYAEAKRIRGEHAKGNAIEWTALRSQLRDLISKSASDEHFKSSLENVLRYDRGTAQKANLREFLTTLEDHGVWLASGNTGSPKPDMMSVFDLDQVTIEHIYPQSPQAGSVDSGLAPLVHQLGNLTFFGPGENSDAGNKSFLVKRDNYYKKSKIRLTRELGDLAEWTTEEYSKRLDRIKSDACKVFRI
ncbi:DUF262 domain-containing protein [Kitasatospora sp. NPDC050543]|uniref:DUF262 domain-containing protein n=1 Tax=Kitasatospora sp. NPDC050543 TaxID=3364054 RepID=UPI00379FC42B